MAGMSPMFRRNDRRTDKTDGEKHNEKDTRESQVHLVTLIRKPGCHLCDDAQAVVEKVCGDLGVPWEQKDITQDEDLHRAYWEQIPVVLVDGAQHTFWRVDEGRLRKALS
ncbi:MULTISPECIES: glutaredoxin family protein [unclassified Streptomyces]|uniref:glutaredoxin family protein n=1 Tax=unclassified Streptomyces TaxID=2593676 RepID=UPI0033B5A2A2